MTVLISGQFVSLPLHADMMVLQYEPESIWQPIDIRSKMKTSHGLDIEVIVYHKTSLASQLTGFLGSNLPTADNTSWGQQHYGYTKSFNSSRESHTMWIAF